MKSKRFTFAQKHSSGFIQCRLDYIFISNTLQEFVTMTEILTPISTDHSPVLFSLSKEKWCFRGKGIWKFNSSFTKDQDYTIEIKKTIPSFCIANKSLSNLQLKWELLKYEVEKFTINYTKQIAKEKRQQRTNLENQLKILEKNLYEDDNLSKYNNIKNQLDVIYDHITEGMLIRSKCNGYEHSKKSTKFFLNLEKQQGVQNTIKKLIVDDKETTDQTHILECIKEFYETLFKKCEQKTVVEIKFSQLYQYSKTL